MDRKEKESTKVVIAVLVAFALVLVVVAKFDFVFYDLQSWVVLVAVAAAVCAGYITSRWSVRVAASIFGGTLFAALACVQVEGAMLFAAIMGVVSLAALAAWGAGLLPNSDSPSKKV